MAIHHGKKGDPVTGLGFQRGVDTQDELWKIQKTTERRKAVLLPCLLTVALTRLIKGSGGETSDDVTTLLSRAAALPLIGIPPQFAADMTIGAMSCAESMLDCCEAEDAAEAVLASAALVLKLADEQQIPGQDYESQAILVSMMLFIEARENPTIGWDLREERLPKMVNKMLDRATLVGIPLL